MDYIRKNCGEKSKIMGMVSNRQKDEAIANFRFEGVLIDERPYGSGHINDTFLLTFDISGMGLLRVILQRMNKEIFTQPRTYSVLLLTFVRRSLKTVEIRRERH